ncbi:hypothetical protein CWI39_0366p0020 [Hamiltosporidium magnivora]|uniref:Uncharacterized protein n=1 Tax=Hamiltosporidium magnivora TaxID=148818 RepID=A0A4Q9LH82_9MICR|nr:hypothetical protein CWI39_0366p0020 [Hamiltosporidium magnivora]
MIHCVHLKVIIKISKIYLIHLIILHVIKEILTQNTILIHFYEALDNSLRVNNSDTSHIYESEKYLTSDFFSNRKILRTKIIDLNIFLLEFLIEEQINQYEIYIYNEYLSYESFNYFYYVVMSFPCSIDNMNRNNYLLILKILNIFKFKINEPFRYLIRLVLVSLVLNPLAFKRSKQISFIETEYKFKSFISKMVICELVKLYMITEKTRSKLKNISEAVILTKNFKFEFINLNEDFLYLDLEIIEEILLILQNYKKFDEILNFILCVNRFRRLFLSYISYTAELESLFSLTLFQNIDEIFFFRCSDTDLLVEKIHQNFDFRNIKILNIIQSKFTIKDEISFLKTLNVGELNYILRTDGLISYFHNSDSNSPINNIFSTFIEEIYNDVNMFNIFVGNTNMPIYDEEKGISLELYQDKTKIEMLRNLEFQYQTFAYMELFHCYLAISFYIINSSKFKNIKLEFTDTDVKDFCLRESEVFNNITEIRITHSKIYENFLANILLFSSLKTLIMTRCTIILSKNEINFTENSKIKAIHLKNILADDQDHFSQFLSNMIALESLVLICFSGDINPFLAKCNQKMPKLNSLTALDCSVCFNPGDDIPDFSILSHLYTFDFGFGYPEGTLHKIFYERNFKDMRFLNLDGIKIGREDMYALEKYTNLRCLRFFNSCKISELAFSQLFDSNKIYFLNELQIQELEFSDIDIFFISKLRLLKKLYIHSFILKTKIFNFLEIFYYVKEIELARISFSKNIIYEELGTRLIKSPFDRHMN